MSHVRLLLTACLLAIGAVVSPLGVGVALADPIADFDWAPKPVVAGAPVTLTSTSTPTDANTPITQIHWDLDGDRRFETRTPTGAIAVTVTAPAPGTWTVTMRVEDAAGEGARVTKEISVEAPPPPPPPPPDPPPPPPDDPPPPPDDPPPPPDDPPPPPSDPPPPPPPANQPPTAAIAVFPASPFVGEEVTFVSYSDDPDGRISEHAWDFDGDGNFDEGSGPVVTQRFSTAGNKQVTLRVKDNTGASSTVSRTFTVRVPPATTSDTPSTPQSRPPPRLLSPFPVVRLAGSVTSRGVNVRILSVRAPARARVLVRCSGRGCPVRRVEKIAGRARVRFSALERWLRAGVVLEVFVRRGNEIGKYTRFEIRGERVPKRTDGCLRPGAIRRAACPRG